MQINITGRQIEITDPIRDYADKRMQLLVRRGDPINKVDLTLASNELRTIYTASATVPVPGKQLHANAESEDMYKSIDELVRKLERQIRKHREKETDHR